MIRLPSRNTRIVLTTILFAVVATFFWFGGLMLAQGVGSKYLMWGCMFLPFGGMAYYIERLRRVEEKLAAVLKAAEQPK